MAEIKKSAGQATTLRKIVLVLTQSCCEKTVARTPIPHHSSRKRQAAFLI
jgi:hypothetical protein